MSSQSENDWEEPEPCQIDEEFKFASERVRKINNKLEDDKLLYLYARFKQASVGPCNIPKPSFFDFQGKAKWSAWHGLGKMPAQQAKTEYIAMVSNLDPSWREKINNEKEEDSDDEEAYSGKGPGLGVAVSTLAHSDDDLSAEEKTVFDWCKDGDVSRVCTALSNGVDINSKDGESLGLIHWAADRGEALMVEALLDFGADINLRDGDQQTALHFAVSCDHTEVAKVLMNRGIDLTALDDEGNSARDVASEDMKSILDSISNEQVT